MSQSPDWHEVIAHPRARALIQLALDEDVGEGDLTTLAIFPARQDARATLTARSPTVACGMPLVSELLRRFDPDAQVTLNVKDGDAVEAGTAMAELHGDVRAILTAERTLLNFLMRLCGIAELTRAAVARLPPDANTQILDTRKTLPGWRLLDKAAVATGGGTNHRAGLYDGIIIKDNHIAAAGSLSAAVEAAREVARDDVFVEVEVDTLEQLDEALAAAPDLVLLDNFTLEMMATAVKRTAGRVPLEASGGMTLERIPEVARTGVDRISMGALTHSALPADLALDFPGSPA